MHRNAAPNLPTRPLSSIDAFVNFTVALLCIDSKKATFRNRIGQYFMFMVPCIVIKLRGLSPRANYTDRAAAAGRRS